MGIIVPLHLLCFVFIGFSTVQNSEGDLHSHIQNFLLSLSHLIFSNSFPSAELGSWLSWRSWATHIFPWALCCRDKMRDSHSHFDPLICFHLISDLTFLKETSMLVYFLWGSHTLYFLPLIFDQTLCPESFQRYCKGEVATCKPNLVYMLVIKTTNQISYPHEHLQIESFQHFGFLASPESSKIWHGNAGPVLHQT